MLKGKARDFYFNTIANTDYTFDTMYRMVKDHFETQEKHQRYLADWRETTLLRTISTNPGKPQSVCLQLTIDNLQKVFKGLPMEYHGANSETILRDQLINACRGVDECTVALFRPAKTFKGVCADLKNAVSSHEVNKLAKSAFFTREREPDKGLEHMYVDRTYARGG